MNFQKIKLFVFLFLVFAFNNLFSQISVSPTVGCAPLTGVAFSGPGGATGITWNFGDLTSSNLASPSHNYTSAGNYTVTYNATVGGLPVTYTALVVVYGNPTASFTYTVPPNHCKPLNVGFTSTSSGPAAIASYTWNFGDGGTGSSNNVTWAYTLQGSFFATLIVADVNGCTSTVSPQQGPINVSNPPTAIISSNPLSLTSCTAPFTAAFSGSNCVSGSPISGGSLSYSWNFGNSQTSSLQTPGNITYNTQGLYTVSLTVTDNNNCSATVTTPVSVSQPSINATIPGTVCLNTPFTFSYQTNQPFSTWNFGVGTPTGLATSSAVSTSSLFTYTAPGTYTISYSVGTSPCIAVQTKTIYVEQVTANFTLTPPAFTCSPTFTASYVNLSSPNATSFTWTAINYNGVTTTTSTATNPTFTFTQGSLNPYTIFYTYSVSVTLIAKSPSGCISTFTTHVFDSIRRPTAWFNTDKLEGCAPLVVKFRDSSFTNTTIYPITSYTWNNGASPPTIVSGVIPPPMVNPTFTYAAPGTYTPFLIVQTASGCIHTSYIHTITVVNPPVINFSVSPTGPVCWNTPVTVSATSTSTAGVQHWHVNSDNGFFSHCINNSTPTWFFTHIGVFTFSVDGYSHSCKGTSTSTQSIQVKGPIAQGRFVTNCAAGSRKTVNFYAELQDVALGTLNFGDNSFVNFVGTPGSIVSYSAAPHTYSASGNYTAVLTTSNAAIGCAPYTYTMLVKVRDVQANFSLTAVGCTSVSQIFDASPSIDVYSGCNKRGYIWYVDNLPPIDTAYAIGPPILSQAFTTAGTHTVLLMVKDENSCLDTTKHTIRISSANPTFSFSANPICLSTGTVQMLNTTAQTPDPITNYIWDFGDGSPLVTTTSLTSPIHLYTSATPPSQNYVVTLTATNSQGCTDVVTHTLTVVNPVANIVPSSNPMCIPTSTNNLATNVISFTAPTGNTSYTFNFGDGSSVYTTTNNFTPLHTYTAEGSYSAIVIVDAAGCKNSSTVVVNAYNYPVPNFSLNTGTVICRDTQVQFSNTSTVTGTPSFNWNLSTGSPILPISPVVWTYTANGSAVITLTVTTNGCASVISKTLSIIGAKANLNIDKQVVCLGNPIKFNLLNDSNHVFGWTYDFGDGLTNTFVANPVPTQTVTHFYNFYPTGGSTSVTVTYYPTSNPTLCPLSDGFPIQVIKINADFDRNNEISKPDSVHCLNVIDNFTNQTPNSSGYNFNWAFGNGSTATGQNPSYTYPLPGQYQVTLTVTDPVNNCFGYTVKNMTINALPNSAISARDTCKNRPFILNASPTAGMPPYSYTWTPSVGVVTPNSPVTSATASNSTTYTLSIKDANGCITDVTKNVYIQLPADSLGWDTTVIVGQVIPLHNNSGSNFTYTWNPVTDLSCTNCPYPVSNSTVNITYSVTIADNMGCFVRVNTHTVIVELKGTVDVPTAFTPNGDGVNDIIYVDGWGIRKLNYFRIFNRWGQLLFESNDIEVGWNGLFNGVPQNMETYVYQVSAEVYADAEKPFLKTGTFKLIR